jgi:hypothetical protein
MEASVTGLRFRMALAFGPEVTVIDPLERTA